MIKIDFVEKKRKRLFLQVEGFQEIQIQSWQANEGFPNSVDSKEGVIAFLTNDFFYRIDLDAKVCLQNKWRLKNLGIESDLKPFVQVISADEIYIYYRIVFYLLSSRLRKDFIKKSKEPIFYRENPLKNGLQKFSPYGLCFKRDSVTFKESWSLEIRDVKNPNPFYEVERSIFFSFLEDKFSIQQFNCKSELISDSEIKGRTFVQALLKILQKLPRKLVRYILKQVSQKWTAREYPEEFIYVSFMSILLENPTVTQFEPVPDLSGELLFSPLARELQRYFLKFSEQRRQLIFHFIRTIYQGGTCMGLNFVNIENEARRELDHFIEFIFNEEFSFLTLLFEWGTNPYCNPWNNLTHADNNVLDIWRSNLDFSFYRFPQEKINHFSPILEERLQKKIVKKEHSWIQQLLSKVKFLPLGKAVLMGELDKLESALKLFNKRDLDRLSMDFYNTLVFLSGNSKLPRLLKFRDVKVGQQGFVYQTEEERADYFNEIDLKKIGLLDIFRTPFFAYYSVEYLSKEAVELLTTGDNKKNIMQNIDLFLEELNYLYDEEMSKNQPDKITLDQLVLSYDEFLFLKNVDKNQHFINQECQEWIESSCLHFLGRLNLGSFPS